MEPGGRRPEHRGSFRLAPPTLTAQRKRASMLVNRIAEEILSEGWAAGHLVGSEAELTKRYGLSKAVVHEAVRLLEHMQIAEMRRGSAGGLVIRQPTPTASAQVLATYFDFVRVGVQELLETRRAIEAFTFDLAIERISETQMIALRAMRDEPTFELDPFVMIRRMAQIARNPALEICIGSLLAPLDHALRAEPVRRAAQVRWREIGLELSEALIRGDVGLGHAALNADLDLSAEIALVQGRKLAEPHPTDRTNLSEIAVRAMIDTIEERQLQPGDIVGTEERLVAELGVSRAALREALRILEYYNIAAMRQGPGGGLVVGRPSPERVVETVSVQLDLMGVTPRQIHEMRRAVELPAIERAALRLTPESERQMRDIVVVVNSMDPEEVNDIGYCLNLLVADTSGSRPLEIFVRIAARLQSERVEQYLQDADEKLYRTRELIAVQSRIAEAVLARDGAVARHRLLRHLEEIHRFVLPEPTLPRRRRIALARAEDPAASAPRPVTAGDRTADAPARLLP